MSYWDPIGSGRPSGITRINLTAKNAKVREGREEILCVQGGQTGSRGWARSQIDDDESEGQDDNLTVYADE